MFKDQSGKSFQEAIFLDQKNPLFFYDVKKMHKNKLDNNENQFTGFRMSLNTSSLEDHEFSHLRENLILNGYSNAYSDAERTLSYDINLGKYTSAKLVASITINWVLQNEDGTRDASGSAETAINLPKDKLKERSILGITSFNYTITRSGDSDNSVVDTSPFSLKIGSATIAGNIDCNILKYHDTENPSVSDTNVSFIDYEQPLTYTMESLGVHFSDGGQITIDEERISSIIFEFTNGTYSTVLNCPINFIEQSSARLLMKESAADQFANSEDSSIIGYDAQKSEDILFLIDVDNIKKDDDYIVDCSLIGFSEGSTPDEGLSTETISDLKLFVSSKVSRDFNITSNAAAPLNDNMTSCMIARTNPRIYGNAKIVIDSAGNIFMDSFKPSRIYNARQYRKMTISANGNYPYDLMTCFGSLPKGEFFAVPQDSLDSKRIYNDFNKQFDTRYEYGAQNNDDKLYSESMKILAPLHLQHELPDFFVIFKVDGPTDALSQDSLTADKFRRWLRDCTTVKVFDLRDSTAIGHYIREYQKMLKSIPHGIQIQFRKQDSDDNIEDVAQGKNTWHGISLNSGVLTSVSETSYFADQILDSNSGSVQEDFDGFLVDGFSRNMIAGADVLSLEWMFDDNSSKSYSMNRYFGLYLKENDFLHYDHIAKNYSSSSKVSFLKYDSSGNLIDDSFLTDADGVLNDSQYADRMFFGVTNSDAVRLKGSKSLSVFLQNNVCNHPGESLFHLKAEHQDFRQCKGFISMSFTEQIKYGEHFRFIIPKAYNSFTNKEQNIVIEIIASNDHRLMEYDDCVFPYVVSANNYPLDENDIVFKTSVPYSAYANLHPAGSDIDIHEFPEQKAIWQGTGSNIDAFPYSNAVYFNSTIYDGPNDSSFLKADKNNGAIGTLKPIENLFDDSELYRETAIWRISFYTQDMNDRNSLAPLNEQLKRLKAALDRFGIQLKVQSMSDSKLSVVSAYDGVWFEHVSSDILNNPEDLADPIRYFNSTYQLNYSLLSHKTIDFSHDFEMFALHQFEILGDRFANIVPFMPVEHDKQYYSFKISDSGLLKMTPVMIALQNDLTYQPLREFKFFNTSVVQDSSLDNSDGVRETFIFNMLKYSEMKKNLIINPLNVSEFLISSDLPLVLHDGYLNIYAPISCNIALMGIFPFRDFDFVVDYETRKTISSDEGLTFEANERIPIDGRFGGLAECALYKLESGRFANADLNQGNNFFIHDGWLYANNLCEKIEEGYLIASQKTVIRDITDKGNFYKYVMSNPYKSSNNFHIDNDKSNKLKWPLSIPVNCLWKSDGNYYDGDSVLNANKAKNRRFQIEMNAYEGHFAEALQKLSKSSSNQYLWNDLRSYVNNGMTIEDVMASGIQDNSMIQYLKVPGNVEFANAFYNQYVNSLNFVWAGLNFSFKFMTNIYDKDIKISNYNGYKVFVINDYASHEENEMIVSEKEETILIINHRFCWPSQQPKESIFHLIGNSISNQIPYTWLENDYYIDFSNVFGGNKNIYAPLSLAESITLKDGEILAEFDSVVFDESNPYAVSEPYYCYFNHYKMNEKQYTGYLNLLYDNYYWKYMNSAPKDADGIPTISYDSLHITSLSNFLTRRSYKIMKNDFYSEQNNTSLRVYSYNPLESYIESFDYSLVLKIIPIDGEMIQLSSNANTPIFSFEITKPSRIKYSQGFFVPVMNDLLAFENEEDQELVEKLDCDFSMANTKINDVLSIKGYIGNKVFNTDKIISLPLTYYNYYSEDRNLLSSSWDPEFYSEFKSSNLAVGIPGYQIGIDDKSFFGSKCIVLNSSSKSIMISRWNYESNIISYSPILSPFNTKNEATSGYEVRINLSAAFNGYFMNDVQEFKKNWNLIDSNPNVYINNYIKNVLSRYYNITDKNAFALYKKDTISNLSGLNLELDKPKDFNNGNWRVHDNYESEYSIDNGEVILTLKLYDYKNTKYYPTLNLKMQ